MTPTLYQCTPRETYAFMLDAIECRMVPFVKSSPGIGKSSLFRKLARHFNLKLIDHRVSTSAPEDFTGLPDFYTDASERRRACFAPFDTFPLEFDSLPKGYDGWLLFLDEFNSAGRSIQAAAYKLILDHMINQTPMHPHVAKGMAGNLATDRAIVEDLSTAMQSRVIHINMVYSFEEWLEDVAFAEGYDPRIIGYLSYKPTALMDFHPDHQDETFACPRTWEFMNNFVKGRDNAWIESRQKLFCGTISSGEAAGFVTFAKHHNDPDIPKIEDVLREPERCSVPYESAKCWFIISMLIEHVDEKTYGTLLKYTGRMSAEFRILFNRMVMQRYPQLRHHPAFAQYQGELAKYLNPRQKAA